MNGVPETFRVVRVKIWDVGQQSQTVLDVEFIIVLMLMQREAQAIDLGSSIISP